MANGGDPNLSFEDWVALGMPSAGTAGGGQRYQIGQSDGGPGTWQIENGIGSRESAYQSKVTGAPEGQQYIVPDSNVASGQTSFDGYDPDTNTLLDAKCWTCWPIDAPFSVNSVIEQARRQQRIAEQTGTTVEWHVPSQETANKVLDAFESVPEGQPEINMDIIRIIVTPE